MFIFLEFLKNKNEKPHQNEQTLNRYHKLEKTNLKNQPENIKNKKIKS
jgi:hypothetical protein